MRGVLALWNDCAPGQEADYEAWCRDEHLPERLAIPGFRRGRRYRALGPGPAFFTCYEVDTPEVLTGEAYLARVNDPSPRTRRIMAGAFRNMSRTICRVAASAGHMRGSVAVTAEVADDGAAGLLAGMAAQPGVARAELWAAHGAPGPQNAEAVIRGGDTAVSPARCRDRATGRRASATGRRVSPRRASGAR